MTEYQKENTQIIGKALNNLQLTDAEKRTINWIIMQDRYTVENLASIIDKAKQSQGKTCIQAKLEKDGIAVDIKGSKFCVEHSVPAITMALVGESVLEPEELIDCVVKGICTFDEKIIERFKDLLS